jgi:opacity protein-like surface antigen
MMKRTLFAAVLALALTSPVIAAELPECDRR